MIVSKVVIFLIFWNIPVFKKGDATDKTNYRPVSTLFSFSKVYEKLSYAQINSFKEAKLSRDLADFRVKHYTQHALLKMIEIGVLC